MRKRLVQVFGFLASSLGWLFVLVTMAMDFWRISQIGGQGGSWIIKVAWYWSNLWKDCYTDSTAVTNCRDYPVLWSVAGESYVQGVRGLLMCGLTLGFFGVVCCFAGMECTYIGGATKTKDKFLLAGSVFHFVGGKDGSCLLRSTRNHNSLRHFVITEQMCFFDQGAIVHCVVYFVYDLGNPIFLGLVGSFLILFGAILYAITVFRVVCPKR
uniref:Claudin n=1 Tax=Gadus morhua TaxID=8049 RepID=A0A8C4YYY6_GADMO